jgi:hypothetical protein
MNRFEEAVRNSTILIRTKIFSSFLLKKEKNKISRNGRIANPVAINTIVKNNSSDID